MENKKPDNTANFALVMVIALGAGVVLIIAKIAGLF